MAKKTGNKVDDNSKWAKFADGAVIGEELVSIFIPKDKMNPGVNHVWIGLNGDGAYLAVGKQIEVPESVAAIWEQSYRETIEAEESITADTEILA